MSMGNAMKDFFYTWDTYRKVLQSDCLCHSEIIGLIKEKTAHMKSLSILDLGCGDSYTIVNAISPDQLRSYLGIDASAAALDFSAGNLSDYRGNITHIHGDLSASLDGLSTKYDLIMAGYSLHHLSDGEKGVCISGISDLLSEDGLFIFYDAFLRENETEEEFNKRVCDLHRSVCHRMDEHEMEEITSHIMTKDHPQTEAFYLEAFRQNGLVDVEKAFQDDNELFALYFVKK